MNIKIEVYLTSTDGIIFIACSYSIFFLYDFFFPKNQNIIKLIYIANVPDWALQ